MCPNSPSFLPTSFCVMFSLGWIRVYKSMFLTFCVHPILSIFPVAFLSKAISLCLIALVTTQASHPYCKVLKTNVCNTFFFVSISMFFAPPDFLQGLQRRFCEYQ